MQNFMEIFKSIQNESISFRTEDIDENYSPCFLEIALHGISVCLHACLPLRNLMDFVVTC